MRTSPRGHITGFIWCMDGSASWQTLYCVYLGNKHSSKSKCGRTSSEVIFTYFSYITVLRVGITKPVLSFDFLADRT